MAHEFVPLVTAWLDALGSTPQAIRIALAHRHIRGRLHRVRECALAEYLNRRAKTADLPDNFAVGVINVFYGYSVVQPLTDAQHRFVQNYDLGHYRELLCH